VHVPASRLQYLESLDSVRVTSRTYGSDDAEAESLQAFLEALATLALGRQFVVPQSYAFDSLPFIQVAGAVIEAQSRVVRKGHKTDLPIRLHLFGTNEYQTTVESVLRRMDADDDTFFESSFLDYDEARRDGAATRAADQLVAGRHPVALFGLVPQQFREDFTRVWNAFAPATRTSRITAPLPGHPSGFPRLHEAMTDLCVSGSGVRRVLKAEGFERRPEFWHLLAAVQKLLAAGGASSFRSRSRLHGDQPWLNDPHGRRAAEIVTDPTDLAMVTELVDTVYNAVVASTTSARTSSYSTTTDTDRARMATLSVAQEVAVAFHDKLNREDRGIPLDIPRTDYIDPAPRAPTFEVAVRSNLDAADDRTRAAFRALRKEAVQTIEAVLELREKDTEFQYCASELELAVRAGDGQRIADQLDAHARLLARRLGGIAAVDSHAGWVKIGIMSGSAALASGAANLGWLLTAMTAGASAAAADFWEQARKDARRMGSARHLTYGMNHLMQIRRVG
jgi:hypothetical protein